MTLSPVQQPQRALVVEDLAPMRASFCKALLEAFPSITVDETRSVQDATAALSQRPHYDVALIDLGLPDGSGIEVIRSLRARGEATTVIVTTIFDDDAHIFHALAAGADGYLLKESGAEALVEHLRQLEAGLAPLSPGVARRILGHFRSPAQTAQPQGVAAVSLTARETEVLSLIGRGLQRAEAASVLGIAENTVAKYVKDIYRKLDISSRAEAALEAQRRGLV